MRDSLWVDELHTSWTIADSVRDVLPRASLGNQGPIYFWLQWGIKTLFGHSEIGLRAVSWISGNILVVTMMLAVKRMTGSPVATLAVGLLMAIDSNLIFYSNEARPYALLQLVAMFAALACYRYTESGATRDRVIWIACSVVICYLHSTAALLLPVFVIALVVSGARSRKLVQRMAADLILIAICLLPLVPLLQQVASRRHNWEQFVQRASLTGLFGTLPTTKLVVFAAIPSAITICIACWLRRAKSDASQSGPQRRWRTFLFAMCWFLIPTAIAFVLNNSDVARLFFRRYLVGVIPASYLAVAILIAFVDSRRMQALVAIAVVCFGCYESYTIRSSPPFVSVRPHTRENWREA
ncbi:MAG: glycosyltransferase family 39 protein, partial [Planctomycetales bacterium]|nr:glycosyltransferase family 39 protein [Planctomycetales bacterium]